jgi:hypothetical protein
VDAARRDDTGDFIGKTIRFGDGSTSTTKGGIDAVAAANAKWRNYAGTYDAVNGEFVKRMRRAFHRPTSSRRWT